MNVLFLIVTCLTALFIVGGILIGFFRGRNRSLLRIALILASAVIAFFLRNVIAGWLGKINVQGQTLQEMINASVNTSELPAEVAEVAVALVNSALGVVGYVLGFVVLSLLTLAIAYPLLKIVVKKEGAKQNISIYPDNNDYGMTMPAGERPKDVKGNYKKQGVKRLWGVVLGAVQGIILSFLIFVPVNGISGTLGQVSDMEVEGKPVVNFDTSMLDEYNQSFIAKIYNATGGWFYRSMSKAQYGEGRTVSVASAGDLASAASEIIPETKNLSTIMDDLKAEGGLTTDNVNKLGDSLIKMGNALNGLPLDAKELLDDMAKPLIDAMTQEGEEPAIKIPENFKVSELDVASVGQVVKDLAPYVSENGEKPEMTKEFADHVVTALANNAVILDIIAANESEPLSLPIADKDKEVVLAAINEMTDVDEKTLNDIKALFGITE